MVLIASLWLARAGIVFAVDQTIVVQTAAGRIEVAISVVKWIAQSMPITSTAYLERARQ